MNKGQLIDAVQGQLGGDSSRAAAEAAVNAVLDSITNAVKGGNVQIIGFGTFKKANRAARTGVNPRTGEKIKIKASTTVTFKAGAKLKAAV
jgi:DNA-binding protein HU-beta